MVVYISNANEINNSIVGKIRDLSESKAQSNSKMLRIIASTLTAKIIERVHENGIAADGTRIGTYSSAYMKVRTGRGYKNAELKTKGKNKGNEKNSGVYTKGNNKGKPRQKFNRTNDYKVILALTNQMQNDLSICESNPIETSNGFAIGYLNKDNYDKAIWNERRYKKKILSDLSADEKDLVTEIANNYTNEHFR